MKKVHISQFYACSKVDNACELYYIIELGKYLNKNHGGWLSLDGVILPETLRTCIHWQYFRVAIQEGWVRDTNLSDVEVTLQNPLMLPRKNSGSLNVLYTTEIVESDPNDEELRLLSAEYDFRTPTLRRISFLEHNEDVWSLIYGGEEYEGSKVNNITLVASKGEQAWTSLVAYVAVERLKVNAPQTLELSFSSFVLIGTPHIFSYLYTLLDTTSALDGWVNITYPLKEVALNYVAQVGYVAWYYKEQANGYLCRWYEAAEKLKLMKKLQIKVGDIVVVYTRKQGNKNDKVKSIESCHYAKVVKATLREITLDCINMSVPRFQAQKDFEDLPKKIKQMYGNVMPYEKLNSVEKTMSLAEVGVDHCMDDELYFIEPLGNIATNDYRTVLLEDKENCDSNNLIPNDGREVRLNGPQLMYAILKSYDYEFNELSYAREVMGLEVIDR